VTADVSEDFSFEAKFANSFAVRARLLRGSRGREFNVLYTEIIEGSGNFDFFGGIKECVGKLLAFSLFISHVGDEVTKVDSMMEKFDTRDRKSSALARRRQQELSRETYHKDCLFVWFGAGP
jgi:hypothetical protein